MLDKEYSVLGVFNDATDEEIEQRYLELKKKYEADMFLDGDLGNQAAKNLTELKAAYAEIKSYRQEQANRSGDGSYQGLYKQVDEAIKANDLQKAQKLLDSFNERPAEWHYLQAVVFYNKNWTNESKKQLEIAKEMDPQNEKYQQTYQRLVDKINKGGESTNGDWNRSYSGGGSASGPVYTDEPQMGGDSCLDFCCRMAICNLCLNCFCNGCCR